MGKVKQAIHEVEEEVVSLVMDIPRRLDVIQKLLPKRLKDNPYANDKELVKKAFNKAVWERDNEEPYPTEDEIYKRYVYPLSSEEIFKDTVNKIKNGESFKGETNETK